MIRSMTGFGKAEAILKGKKIVVEMKSLNHRYLEVSLRAPAILSPFEIEIKKKIGEQFSRGRIEITVRIEESEELDAEGQLALNLPRIRYYYNLMTQLKDELKLPDDITLSMLAGLKDVFIPKDTDSGPVVSWQDLEGVLHESMTTLLEMRHKEGEILKLDLVVRIGMIQDYLNGISLRAPAIVLEYKKRLTDRIKELTNGIIVDEARLCQEIAIMAEKSDITEEIVRLESHIGQFNDLLNKGESIGRKVDFLIQEMNREVNTIGSKSGDADIAKSVIEIKSELARLREQVQNIE